MSHEFISGSFQPPRRRLFSIRSWSLLALLFLPVLNACDDDPFKIKWESDPDTVLLYSLARPELNLLSAFDFVRRVPVRIESPSSAGEWDLAIDTQDGELVFLPPGAVGIQNSKARITELPGVRFLDLKEAPRDSTLYVSDRGLPIHLGSTYVFRTRQESGLYGQICVFYGKLEPLAVDAETGTVTFVYDASPDCNNRRLIPNN